MFCLRLIKLNNFYSLIFHELPFVSIRTAFRIFFLMLKEKGLSAIKNPMNSVLIERKFVNVDLKFRRLVSIAENLPRTTVIESGKNYWRGVCKSAIFRFPDDLEILKLDGSSYLDRLNGTIQIRSAARLGQSDLGVNQKRVNYLLQQLENLS